MTTKSADAAMLRGLIRHSTALALAVLGAAALLAACGGVGSSSPRSVSVGLYQGQPVVVSTSAGQWATVRCGESTKLEEPSSYDQPWTVTITKDDQSLLTHFTLARGSEPPAGGPLLVATAASGANVDEVYAYAIDGLHLPAEVPLTPGNPRRAHCNG
jgi:hypothetical protein